MHNHKVINIIFILLLTSFLSACSMFSPVKIEPVTKHLLKDAPKVKKLKKHHDIILVAPINTYSLYDSEKMAYSIDPYTIDYFVKNEWAIEPAKMIQPLVVKTLERTNYFKGVMTLPTYASYNLILNLNLLELRQLFFYDTSYYQIKMKADLIQPRTAHLIASKEFATLVRVNENNPKSGVYAANIGLKKILKEIANFSIKK